MELIHNTVLKAALIIIIGKKAVKREAGTHNNNTMKFH